MKPSPENQVHLGVDNVHWENTEQVFDLERAGRAVLMKGAPENKSI